MTRTDNRKLFVFGLGYVAKALAIPLVTEGWTVSGTTRSEAKILELADHGIEAYSFDTCIRALETASHIIMSLPPCEDAQIAFELFKQYSRHNHKLLWVGYLSATSVYGDAGGGEVNEDFPTNPNTERGQARLEDEERWQKFCREKYLPLHTFRIAGIYGPERNILASLSTGMARTIHKEGQIFSRIHVSDLVATLRASMHKPNPLQIYNVADDYPASNVDVAAFGAELLHVDAPYIEDFDTAEMSDSLRSFYAGSKRIDNRRIKNELGVILKYPSYREGLEALSRNVLD